MDDGPEYTPDGTFIYFNSMRSGLMQIWRMAPDGSDQEQVTNDPLNNWFPHISPDGRSIAMISFPKEIDAADRPYYKHVYLRVMPIDGGAPTVVAYVYGGQGTINVPSWSPDSVGRSRSSATRACTDEPRPPREGRPGVGCVAWRKAIRPSTTSSSSDRARAEAR